MGRPLRPEEKLEIGRAFDQVFKEHPDWGYCETAKSLQDRFGRHWKTLLQHYATYRKQKTVKEEAVPKDAIQQLTDTVQSLTQELANIKNTIYSPVLPTPISQPEITFTQDITVEAFISDLHLHPEHGLGHDPAAWLLARKIIQDLKPDIVFWGGDIADCYSASRYQKKPRLSTPEAFKAEMDYVRQELFGFVKSLPESTEHIWLTGNHEQRIPKNVLTNAPWLMGEIQSAEDRIGLSEINVKIVEDGYKIGKLAHFHGDLVPGTGRVNTAKNKFDRLNMNMIFGHCHRFSEWIPRDQDHSYRGSWGNGCLHWLTAEYTKFPEWHLGFRVIEYARNGTFHVSKVLIHKPSVWSPIAEAIFRGKHYKVDMRWGDDKNN